MRVGFQLFLALLATAIGIGLVVMVRDAVTSRSVVIESFDTPPALAASGVSGRVVAAGLLDVLTGIQAASRTGAERRSLSNAWTSEIAIEVPETGVSIGQIERMLKSRFGHDLHIDGDLVQTEKGGLALTVRGSGILPKAFTDEARNLDKLLTEAGEYVYGQSQPGLWAAYLSNNDRNVEAIPGVALAKHGDLDGAAAKFKDAHQRGPHWADPLKAWGDVLVQQSKPKEALAKYEEALKYAPSWKQVKEARDVVAKGTR